MLAIIYFKNYFNDFNNYLKLTIIWITRSSLALILMRKYIDHSSQSWKHFKTKKSWFIEVHILYQHY